MLMAGLYDETIDKSKSITFLSFIVVLETLPLLQINRSQRTRSPLSLPMQAKR